jgi:diguanylate cyclase (GGDEF)-like protein/PAS domain S-box-containing protein
MRSIFEYANGVIFTLSPQGKFIFVSRGSTEILGYENSQIIGQLFESYVHPEDVRNCRNILHKVLATGETVKEVEYRIKHIDGTWRWHTSSGAAIKDEDGNHIYVVGLAVDITERKQVETDLNISEEKFSKAFHCSPDPIAITNLEEGRFIEVNDAFVDLSGYQRHEAIGHTSTELGIWLAEEDREYVVKLVKELCNIRDFEVKFRMKSNEIRDFLLSAEIINMAGEQKLLYVMKDITERKRMEEALRLSEERFSKAFYTSPVPMAIVSLKDERVIDINASACRMSGYGPEEIRSKNTLSLGFWLDPTVRQGIKQDILEEKSVYDIERSFYKKDGELRLASYSGEYININGEPCILSAFTDITERKRAEEEINFLTFHDKLTGLYNRVFFEEELKRIDTERQLPISIIIGDVNGLKLINDALGHHEGDRLLINVAETLKNSCRQEDVVARWGGDEFIILLPGCNQETATKIMKRIIEDSKHINDLPIQTIISLGLASKNTINRNLREAIREAEENMYRNKLLESRSTRSSFLNSLQQTLWTRSYETEAHCRRMQDMALLIAKSAGLPESEWDNLKLLTVLHDIGKIAIPNSILDKPEALCPDEWELVKKHPEIGYRIALSSPEMAPIAEAILHHHERWDGTGYPLGIHGENIPLLARIVAIADSYDVMKNGRPYQKAISHEKAWAEIEKKAGSQFDPYLVERTRNFFNLNLEKAKDQS